MAPEHLVVDTAAIARAHPDRGRDLRRAVVGAGRRRLRHRLEPRAADERRGALPRRPVAPPTSSACRACRRCRAPGCAAGADGDRARRRRRPGGARRLDPDAGVVMPTSSQYQREPELGDGLRLHLNENTGGCSPRVIEALRALSPHGRGDLSRLQPRHRRVRASPRRRSVAAAADQRPRRGDPRRGDRVSAARARRRVRRPRGPARRR